MGGAGPQTLEELHERRLVRRPRAPVSYPPRRAATLDGEYKYNVRVYNLYNTPQVFTVEIRRAHVEMPNAIHSRAAPLGWLWHPAAVAASTAPPGHGRPATIRPTGRHRLD